MTTTTVTPKVERKNGGMPKWAVLSVSRVDGKWRFYLPYTSEVGGKRFLTRFIFLFTRWGGCHVTRISMADDQREWPHDHSATFWSWKFGSYDEDVFDDPDDLSVKHSVKHRRFGIHRLRYDQAHSITRVSPRLVTILFLGPRRQASNYWTPEGKQGLGMKMDEW
jgi:hypothetical protein